ncbi:hypothetical protein EG830_16035, partial [bacterium]|nr:hypothetical protein [bacterium]
MKKVLTNRIVLTLILLYVVSSFHSCDWFRTDPDYVGTWQYTEKRYSGEVAINITHTLKLTEGTFEEIIIYRRDNSSTVMTLLGMKGNITVDDNKVLFRLTAIGDCLEDTNENCTAAPEW